MLVEDAARGKGMLRPGELGESKMGDSEEEGARGARFVKNDTTSHLGKAGNGGSSGSETGETACIFYNKGTSGTTPKTQSRGILQLDLDQNPQRRLSSSSFAATGFETGKRRTLAKQNEHDRRRIAREDIWWSERLRRRRAVMKGYDQQLSGGLSLTDSARG